ncbi:NRAMP family divalent metal transporter [Salinarchaeum laminariae]|uniref:NRAMP family divalent metal transporter n=1 Tax=Salinarchaeum laminariae TaxID=869888 RepID=UPI0020C0B0BE|nr:divalent metal cation transporter [Salinarchaeum laminariae]
MSKTSSDGSAGRLRGVAAHVGPTWIAGAIAAGPATMASLVAAGAGYGYTLLWVVVLSAGFGALAQYLAALVGLHTEAGIVAVVEEHLGEVWAWLLVLDVVLAAGLAQIVIMKTVAEVSSTLVGGSPELWGVAWAVILAVGLAGGGYALIEWGAKVLVSAVVVLFVASVFLVPVDLGAAAGGLVPAIPDVDAALLAAAILGGAVHVTLITMQSYTMRARDWTAENEGLLRVDVAGSMLVAFGLYSLAIFVVAATVLDPGQGQSALGAAEALGPAVGGQAENLFLLGLAGAAVTTLGANTVVPPYLVADKLGWEPSVSDARFRIAIVAFAAAGAIGPFLGGAFFQLLSLTLAFGLVGTPFALVVVLALLNDPEAVPVRPSIGANVGGVLLVAVTTVIAGDFVRGEWDTLVDGGMAEPTAAAVVAFAAVLGLGTLGVAVRAVRDVLDRRAGSGAPN